MARSLSGMVGEGRGAGLILAALRFAAWKHRDQRRKGPHSVPYINHPIDLANVLWFEGQVRDPLVIAAAILHDTIEDTETTPDELRGRVLGFYTLLTIGAGRFGGLLIGAGASAWGAPLALGVGASLCLLGVAVLAAGLRKIAE